MGIIGVVAAIVLGNIIPKLTDRKVVAKVHKAHNLVANAVQLAINENGMFDQWSTVSKANLLKELGKHLEYTEMCTSGGLAKSGSKKCLTYGEPSMRLKNGITLSVTQFRAYSASGHGCRSTVAEAQNSILTSNGVAQHYGYCAEILVNIDGEKEANIANIKDGSTFSFRVFTDGVVPCGFGGQATNSCSFPMTAWIAYKDNIYLKCKSKIGYSKDKWKNLTCN